MKIDLPNCQFNQIKEPDLSDLFPVCVLLEINESFGKESLIPLKISFNYEPVYFRSYQLTFKDQLNRSKTLAQNICTNFLQSANEKIGNPFTQINNEENFLIIFEAKKEISILSILLFIRDFVAKTDTPQLTKNVRYPDLNALDRYIEQEYKKANHLSQDLRQNYHTYKRRIKRDKKKLNLFKKNLLKPLVKYKKNNQYNDVIQKLEANLNKLTSSASILTPTVYQNIMKLLAEAHEEATKIKNQRSFLERLLRYSTNKLARQIKDIFLKNIENQTTSKKVRKSDPELYYYKVAEYFYEKYYNYETAFYFSGKIAVYLQKAIHIDQGRHLINFLRKFEKIARKKCGGIRWADDLNHYCQSSKKIALAVLFDAELRSTLETHSDYLCELLKHFDWSTQEAAQLANLIITQANFRTVLIKRINGEPTYATSFSKLILSPAACFSILKDKEIPSLLTPDQFLLALKNVIPELERKINFGDSATEITKFFLQVKRFKAALRRYSSKTIQRKGALKSLFKQDYIQVFSGLEKQAMQGNESYQLLLARLHYDRNIPFKSSISEEIIDKWLYSLAQKGSKSASTLLMSNLSKILCCTPKHQVALRYYAGKLSLNEFAFEEAYDCFTRIPYGTDYYSDARFECGNLFFDRRIRPHYSTQETLSAAADNFKQASKAGCEDAELLYKVVRAKIKSFDLSVADAYKLKHDITYTESKKLSLDKFKELKASYKQNKPTLFSWQSEETKSTIDAALTATDDEKRYKIIRKYVSNEANHHRRFCKILLAKLEEDFFSAPSPATHINNEADENQASLFNAAT